MVMRAFYPIVSTALLLASCSFGPHLQAGLPQVRDVPVLAGLSPQESLVRARSFLGSRQYGLAIELFKTAGRDPALAVDSLNGLAIAYDGIGRSDIAERYFQKALALRTDDGRTRRNLAAFYAASGQEEKRQALLADAGTVPAKTEASVAKMAEGSGAVPDTQAANAVPLFAGAQMTAGLESFSPLGAMLRPLLVNVSLPSRPTRDAAMPASDVAVVCTADPGMSGKSGPAKVAADGPMTMFRVSIGEVFITSQPNGTTCSVEGGDRPLAPEQGMSNKAYLGMVAAYLDRLNMLQLLAELSVANSATT